MKPKKLTTAIVAFVAVMGTAFAVHSFAAPDPAPTAGSSRKFEKTKNKCTNSNCQCSGYWGYKHLNGTYEGSCANSDGFGHTCKHGPEKHGLRKW